MQSTGFKSMYELVGISSVITFLCIFIVFILSIITYYKLSNDLSSTDITQAKRTSYQQAKSFCLVLIILSGIIVFLYSYMFLFRKPAFSIIPNQFLGCEEKCTGSDEMTVSSH